jgi:hypothetical protein
MSSFAYAQPFARALFSQHMATGKLPGSTDEQLTNSSLRRFIPLPYCLAPPLKQLIGKDEELPHLTVRPCHPYDRELRDDIPQGCNSCAAARLSYSMAWILLNVV